MVWPLFLEILFLISITIAMMNATGRPITASFLKYSRKDESSSSIAYFIFDISPEF